MAKSPQCIVYVLKNYDDPPRFYTGVTADLVARSKRTTPAVAHTQQSIGRGPWTS